MVGIHYERDPNHLTRSKGQDEEIGVASRLFMLGEVLQVYDILSGLEVIWACKTYLRNVLNS